MKQIKYRKRIQLLTHRISASHHLRRFLFRLLDQVSAANICKYSMLFLFIFVSSVKSLVALFSSNRIKFCSVSSLKLYSFPEMCCFPVKFEGPQMWQCNSLMKMLLLLTGFRRFRDFHGLRLCGPWNLQKAAEFCFDISFLPKDMLAWLHIGCRFCAEGCFKDLAGHFHDVLIHRVG